MTRSNAVTHDYYEILNIQSTGTTAQLSKQQLKLAYHKALLKHHPDKASSVAKSPELPQSNQDLPRDSKTYTIDEITTAYKTLSDPQLRAEYDRALRLDRAKVVEREKTGAVFHTGLEVVDLEDLACEEEGDSAFWYRGCRCGDEKGFLVSEEDLEREAEHGEIVIGCRGCSLWMKVLFAVEEDG
ncbi:CSL zinc finger-domain-containing protein [Aspergillus pseudonomiae]|uniref:Diphthamide biosynthesis protein 4 n=1 Tax=Aspergillus pseudonomiae TaxID=1506151 RepID=A0A5N6IKY6_9EURO|nr:CSL zinc finger-domain-containing protein [Aspergillus pseudonomiae]KAB8265803.1 CSL zinc finger-domain-containing protein [Aspergillus pseudonomiae]KAE8401050.1 CSL zinc finger-domain-containing protein [Aspergillus pseudonomiae]